MTELTDTERETLIEAIQAGTEVEFVEAILTARLAEAPRVELQSEIGKATTCKVWRRGRLVFVGQDYTAAALAAPTPTEVQP